MEQKISGQTPDEGFLPRLLWHRPHLGTPQRPGSRQGDHTTQDVVELPKQKLEVHYAREDIEKAYKNIVNKSRNRLNQNAKNIDKIAIVDHYTVAEKVKEMFKVLVLNKKFVFNKLFSSKKCDKEEIVTAFTGLLELSRRSKVTTEQEVIFGDITVEKANRKAEGDR